MAGMPLRGASLTLRIPVILIIAIYGIEPGHAIQATIHPMDPVVRVGDNLILSCTLDANATDATACDIIWKKWGELIPSECNVTSSNMTSLMKLNEIAKEDSGKYYCMLEDDVWIERSGVQVHVGLPPTAVENVTCDATTTTDFWCSWDDRHADSNLAVDDIVKYKPQWSVEFPWMTCKLTGRGRCQGVYDENWGSLIHIEIFSTNALGNATYTKYTDLYDIIRPEPPRDVTVSPPSRNCLAITWNSPSGWNEASELDMLVYKIRYRDVDDSSSEEVELPSSPTNGSYTLCALQSYTTYEVELACKFLLGELYSEWSTPTIATTLSTVPSSPPQNLTLRVSTERSDWVLVTWSAINSDDENGIITSYVIYSCMVNQSLPRTFLDGAVAVSHQNESSWKSDVCIGNVTVETMTVSPEDRRKGLFAYTSQKPLIGRRYMMWVAARNVAGESPRTRPCWIALPAPEQVASNKTTGVVIISVITFCQLIFFVGIGVCCWQAGLDLFKSNRTVPEPYIPQSALSLKQEKLTPRPPCSGESFDEIRPLPDNRMLLAEPEIKRTSVIGNSGASSVDHGFYDMQGGSGSGSTSCPSQYNSANFHSAATMRCNINVIRPGQLVVMRDPATGYSFAAPFCKKEPKPIASNAQEYPSSSVDVLESDDGYVQPNGAVVDNFCEESPVSPQYDRPTPSGKYMSERYRSESGQSETTTALSSQSDQGFGSAESEAESNRDSPTATTSPSFQKFCLDSVAENRIKLQELQRTDAFVFGSWDQNGALNAKLSADDWPGNGTHFPEQLSSICHEGPSKLEPKTSCRRSSSESDSCTGYMTMGIAEEACINYSYVVNDTDSGQSSVDDTDCVVLPRIRTPEGQGISTENAIVSVKDVDSSGLYLDDRDELFVDIASFLLRSGLNEVGSVNSLKCAGASSSPPHLQSESPAHHSDDEHSVLTEEEEIDPYPGCAASFPSSYETASAEGKEKDFVAGYVSLSEGSRMLSSAKEVSPKSLEMPTVKGGL